VTITRRVALSAQEGKMASGPADRFNSFDNPVHTSDLIIVCRDCGSPFSYSVGEQGFYGRLRLATPTRCVSCRAARKIKYQLLKGS
jgi:putative zinc ribbon protein